MDDNAKTTCPDWEKMANDLKIKNIDLETQINTLKDAIICNFVKNALGRERNNKTMENE